MRIRTSHGGLSVPILPVFSLPGMLTFFVPGVELCLLRATISERTTKSLFLFSRALLGSERAQKWEEEVRASTSSSPEEEAVVFQ